MIYEILSIERFEGVPKRTNKPYDLTRFYAVSPRQFSKVRDHHVEQIDVRNGEYAPDVSGTHPKDFVDISYGRGGSIEERRLVSSPSQWKQSPRPPVQPRSQGYPLPLDCRKCQVPGGNDLPCHGCAYGIANMKN